MTPEIWSVAISNILLGFIAGLAVEAFSSRIRNETLNISLQKAIDCMFRKDEEIDELTSELETLKRQYSDLYDAAEVSRRAYESVKDLPPPSGPLERSGYYVDHTDLPRCAEFSNPQTPTCAPSSTG